MDRVDYQLHLFAGSDDHTPGQRQFVATISAAVEITCAGGPRLFGPGDVLSLHQAAPKSPMPTLASSR